MMPCSRTPLQPQRPTPPPHLDQWGRSGRTPLPAHLQLGLESNLSTKGTRKVQKVLARLTRLNKQGLCKGSNKNFRVK